MVNTYLINHEPKEGVTQDDLFACVAELVPNLPEDMKWVMSWYISAENLLICHWEAPNADAIRAALTQAGVCDIMPITKVLEATPVHPEWYVAK